MRAPRASGARLLCHRSRVGDPDPHGDGWQGNVESRGTALFHTSVRPGSVLLAITGLGLVLRIAQSGLRPLQLDESTSVLQATLPLPQLFEALRESRAYMPLYYVLLHYWIKLGQSEAIIRGLSACFGVATIPICYLVARELVGKRAALVTALVFAVSPFQIYYAETVKMYALFGLLGTLQVYFFLCILKGNQRRAWIGYLVCSILVIYTHFYGFFLFLAEGAYITFTWRMNRQHALRLSVCQGIAVVTFLPWLTTFLGAREHLAYSVERGLALTVVRFPLLLFQMTSGVMSSDYYRWEVVAPAALLAGGLSVRGFFSMTNERQARLFLMTWLVVPMAAALVLMKVIKLFVYARYLIWAAPAFYIFIATGIQSLRHPTARWLAGGSVVAMSAAFLLGHGWTQASARHDMRSAAQYIEQVESADDVVLVYISHMIKPFSYYYGGAVPVYGLDNVPTAADVRTLVGSKRRIWLLLADAEHQGVPERSPRRIQDILDVNYSAEARRTFKGVDIYLYR